MYPYWNVFGRRIGLYGVCMALAFLVFAVITGWQGKKKGIAPEAVAVIAATALGMALLCGKLLYIAVTYPFSQILIWLRNGNLQFLEDGGIVFYGGLLGGILGAYLGSKIIRQPLAALEDVLVPYIPLGQALGRIGCTLAGCCYGIPYEGAGALHYRNSLFGLSPEQGYFPVQPLEAILDVGICLYLLRYRRRQRRTYDLIFMELCLYALIRFCLEFLRGDSIRGSLWIFTTSQWISLGIIAAALTRICLIKRKTYKPRLKTKF